MSEYRADDPYGDTAPNRKKLWILTPSLEVMALSGRAGEPSLEDLRRVTARVLEAADGPSTGPDPLWVEELWKDAFYLVKFAVKQVKKEGACAGLIELRERILTYAMITGWGSRDHEQVQDRLREVEASTDYESVPDNYGYYARLLAGAALWSTMIGHPLDTLAH